MIEILNLKFQGEGKCRYFEWKDEKFTSWSIKVINGLRKELLRLENELTEFRLYGCERCRGRIIILEYEIQNLNLMLSEATGEAAKWKKKIRLLNILLGVALICIALLLACNV